MEWVQGKYNLQEIKLRLETMMGTYQEINGSFYPLTYPVSELLCKFGKKIDVVYSISD